MEMMFLPNPMYGRTAQSAKLELVSSFFQEAETQPG